MSRRLVRARLLARSGRFGEAERIAREAVALGDGVDDLNELARKENASALARLMELRERLAAGAMAG